ncbi:MAG: hypothetical protein NUV51_03615 [Sulfuricaulis sp.]|nr:hypothetical protein [Sulfuricaulis sp.]
MSKRYDEYLAQASAIRKRVLAGIRKGRSQSEMAKEFGVSRQRVHQIVRANEKRAG